MPNSLIQWEFFPDWETFGIPDFSTPIPEWPFDVNLGWITEYFYPLSLHGGFPIAIAIVYFCSVHYLNTVVQKRQIKQFKATHPKEEIPKNLKKLPAAPYAITKMFFFKPLVLLHNILLCVYSVWTFIGFTKTISYVSNNLTPLNFKNFDIFKSDMFWQCMCNENDGFPIWSNYDAANLKGLTFWGYLFYLSKYYEIIDTIIILLKGRPSSLLQSYHHSGAILCMWSGVRYMSSPIWIFVVFNSFIHSIMYGYFTLSCLKIRVPKIFKQSLTTMQITQFIVGGSLALAHLFIKYLNIKHDSYLSCIGSPEKALAVYINVFYLAPLTMLFASFYIDSYRKQQKMKKK